MGFWLTFLVYLATTILLDYLKPKPQIENAKPASLGDFSLPTAEEGRAVPVVFGTVKYRGPNIGWYGDLKAVAIRKKVKTGLFSSKRVTTGYKYYLGIQFFTCFEWNTALQAGIRRVWVDDKIIRGASASLISNGSFSVNLPNFFGFNSGGISGTFQVYDGRTTQAQSSYLAGQSDIDSTLLPNYRGFVSVEAQQIYVGDSPTLRPFAFELHRIPNPLGLSAADAIIRTWDANPANVIYEILTNADWGLGYTNVDTANFIVAAQTLKTEGNGYSRIMDRPQQAVELLNELQQQIDGFIVKDPATRQWQIKLIRETDYLSPVTDLPLFDESNISDMTFSRGTWADTSNQVKVQFTNRNKEYNTTFALAQDMANRKIQNDDDVINTVVYPGVQNETLANELSWRDLRTLSYPLAKGQIISNRAHYTLVPGDLVRVTWPPYELENAFFRINRAKMGTTDNNEIVYDVVEDAFTSQQPSYADPPATLWTAPDEGPVDVADARIWPTPLGFQDQNSEQTYALLAARGNGIQTAVQCWVWFDPSINSPIDTNRANTYELDNIVQPFTPTGLLDGAITKNNVSPFDDTANVITFNEAEDLDLIADAAVVSDLDLNFPVHLALMGDEILFFEGITDLGGGQYQMTGVHRGMLDTAPEDHDDNTRIWFFSAAVGQIEIPPTTEQSITCWFMSESGGGVQGNDLGPQGSPETGVVRVLDITDTRNSQRFQAPSAPIDVQIEGVQLDNVVTLGDAFTITMNNRLNSFTVRSAAQDAASADLTGENITYAVRIYHTGVSPEVLVYEQTGISSAPTANSPNTIVSHQVSGYAVDFSPITSPWPSPQPFAQTYRIEIEAEDNDFSPVLLSHNRWIHSFTRA